MERAGWRRLWVLRSELLCLLPITTHVSESCLRLCTPNPDSPCLWSSCYKTTQVPFYTLIYLLKKDFRPARPAPPRAAEGPGHRPWQIGPHRVGPRGSRRGKGPSHWPPLRERAREVMLHALRKSSFSFPLDYSRCLLLCFRLTRIWSSSIQRCICSVLLGVFPIRALSVCSVDCPVLFSRVFGIVYLISSSVYMLRRAWWPLRYSCLKNPMDRGAWRARVTGSRRVGHGWAQQSVYVLIQPLNVSLPLPLLK